MLHRQVSGRSRRENPEYISLTDWLPCTGKGSCFKCACGCGAKLFWTGGFTAGAAGAPPNICVNKKLPLRAWVFKTQKSTLNTTQAHLSERFIVVRHDSRRPCRALLPAFKPWCAFSVRGRARLGKANSATTKQGRLIGSSALESRLRLGA